MEKIISHLRQTYAPCGIVVYGSYADGTGEVDSDFDALVISGGDQIQHDTNMVDGVRLDVFVYPKKMVEKGLDPEEVIQIFDGVILLDTEGVALGLKQQVIEYLNALPRKTEAQLKEQILWCRKMLLRTQRGDAEGMFRWHWLLVDSLEIFCDKIGRPYFGPKKALKWMQQDHPRSFECYENALRKPDHQALSAWIDCLEQI